MSYLYGCICPTLGTGCGASNCIHAAVMVAKPKPKG
jgi:hypothetical protein